MITQNFPMIEADPTNIRRRALANVYEFLLKLAEAKRQTEDPAANGKQEKDDKLLKDNVLL